MKLETVIDVVFNTFPDKILIYLRDKLLFNGDVKYLLASSYLENMYV